MKKLLQFDIGSLNVVHSWIKQLNQIKSFNMKKVLAILALVGFVGAAYAGPYGGGKYVVEKNPVVPPPPPCYAGGFELGVFGAGIFPSDSDLFSDELGGGVSLGYFFNENLGIDFGAAWFATDSVIHVYTADVVFRMPFDCIAPYVFAGGGVHTNSHTTGLWRIGAGVDFRLSDGYSIFADGSYNWLGSAVPDYAIARVGLRFAF
jgi:hypothetical protein